MKQFASKRKQRFFVQEKKPNGTIGLVWSFMLDFENNANPYDNQKESIAEWKQISCEYPHTFALADEVHNTRYVSMYSHPRVKRTGKPTKKINYRFLTKAKRLLEGAIRELAAAGY